MLSPIILVKQTSNKKVGKIAVTIANAPSSCPSSCPLRDAGCYAQSGPSAIHSRRALQMNNDVGAFIRNLPENGKIRHFVSGDIMNADDTVNEDLVNHILAAHNDRPDVKGYGYTHAYKKVDAAKMNSTASLTYNASCESDDEVENALRAGWPVVRVVPQDTAKITELPMFTQIVCPQQTNDKITCEQCMLCAKKDRKRNGKPLVVAFRVHGAMKNTAAKSIAARNEVN